MIKKIKPSVVVGMFIGSLSACSHEKNLIGSTSNDEHDAVVQDDYSLQNFNNCSQAFSYIQRNMIENMEARIRRYSDRPIFPMGDLTTMKRSGEPGTGEYTTTNVQIDGIDEADIIKNTGTNIYTINNNSVSVVQSWPPQEIKEIAKVTVSGRPTQLLLPEQNKLVVFSTKTENERTYGEDFGIYRMIRPWWPVKINTFVTVFNVLNPEKPVLISEYTFPGRLFEARNIGSDIQLIFQSDMQYPKEVKWYVDTNNLTPEQRKISIEKLIQTNKRIIMEKSLNNWLENVKFTQGSYIGMFNFNENANCKKIYQDKSGFNTSLVRVVNLKLKEPFHKQFDQNIVLTDVENMHRSFANLYLVKTKYINSTEEYSSKTIIHKFSIPEDGKLKYLASGVIQGSSLNQFSFDEYQGLLRVATTKNVWKKTLKPGEVNPNWTQVTTNNLSVLQEKYGKLVEIGSTGDFEKGESLYAVRFYQDKAFAVTFRQVDPLFTIDLSNPKQPKIVGALKVPGFSSYIHFVSPTNLLTIGQYIPEPGPDGVTNWSEQSLKLSLYDVSDFANPKEKHTYLLPKNVWSEAKWEHKAFTYFKAKNMLAIPVTGYKELPPNWISIPNFKWSDYYFSSLELFNVDVKKGIAPFGSLNMNDLTKNNPTDWYWWQYNSYVQRSIFAKDFVYALSNLGIRVSSLANLANPLATLSYLPPPNVAE